MRKLSAILLLCIFVFSQYARQLSYLECKFANTFKAGTAKCDCEKQAGFEIKDASEPPLSKIHTHIHLDEYFNIKEITFPASINIIDRLPLPPYADAESNGCYPKPWQPPTT